MNKLMTEMNHDLEVLAKDTGNLVEGAAAEAGKMYDDAQKRLASVLEHGKEIYGDACKQAARSTRAADVVLHDNLYRTVLVGLGMGILMGYLLSRRSAS